MKNILTHAACAITFGLAAGGIVYSEVNVDSLQRKYPSLSATDAQDLRYQTTVNAGASWTLIGAVLGGLRTRRKQETTSPKPAA